MKTIYELSPGFNWINSELAWPALVEAVKRLQLMVGFVVSETTIMHHHLGAYDVRKMAEAMLPTVVIDEEDSTVTFVAALEGRDRLYEDSIIRAFCRLVIVDMHRKQLEVNLSVYEDRLM